ncbi:class I SAM-dependent methyltransferase [Pseudomonas putida]
MNHELQVEALFDEWAIEDGAVDMAREHWARVKPVLGAIAPRCGRYLEIGPGNGYALDYMASTVFADGQCHAVELSQEMARICNQRMQGRGNVVIEIDSFLSWNPPAGTGFDLIFSMEVFYYFEDIAAAIAKAAGLLAAGGELIVMVDYFQESPASQGWSQELGLKLTRWSQAQYLEAFCAAGLQAVTQELKSGGVQEHGVTLCTRGRREPAAD